jgi:CheY-like chemotaxis protein
MSKRILVVEDQPDSRRIIRDMLAPTDYEITEAENGEEALAAIAKQRPDLILMDVQLPNRRRRTVVGPDLEDIVRRAAPYVDRILHGENPADLPVQVPTKFQLVVNLKTAKALGLTISRDFLLVADEVIE